MKKIVRFNKFAIELKETRDSSEVKNKLVGYASVFDSETVIGGYFREVIRKGAFKRAIAENQDVVALFNHNDDYVLGRTSAGTLNLIEDEKGLKVEIDLPDTQLARDLKVQVDTGNINQMSFAFYLKKSSWKQPDNENSLGLREILDVDLVDVSIVTHPQYTSTSIGLRGENSDILSEKEDFEAILKENEPEKKEEAPENNQEQEENTEPNLNENYSLLLDLAEKE